MKKILILFISLFVFTSCTDYIQKQAESEIKYKELSHSIDSLNKVKQNYIYNIDSLHALQHYIISHQETRERNDRLIAERKSIENDINYKTNIRNELVRQNDALNKQIANNKFAIDASKYVYIVKIKIHQTTYSLSISEHVKNSMNNVEFEIPVDKEYYDKCYNGQTVTDPGLKIGSLLRDGDFSKLKIKIIGKRKVKRN